MSRRKKKFLKPKKKLILLSIQYIQRSIDKRFLQIKKFLYKNNERKMSFEANQRKEISFNWNLFDVFHYGNRWDNRSFLSLKNEINVL